MSQTLLTVIDHLYAAALLPAQWPHALQGLAAACGALGATVSRGPIPERALASPSLEASTADYADTWWKFDDRQRRVSTLFRGAPLTESDVTDANERRRDPFYQEFLKSYGLESFGAVLLEPLPGMRLGLTVERGSKPFTARELQTLSALSGHVSRALAVTMRLGLTEAFANHVAYAVEQAPCGIVLLSPDGKVIFVNALAQRLLGKGLALKNGELQAEAPGGQSQLERALATLRSGSGGGSQTFFMKRIGSPGVLAIQALALPPRREHALERLGLLPNGVVVLVYDLAADEIRSVTRELERMGLTRAQARVAEAVGRGHSVKEAADLLGVVESTARTQLKAAYARLGVGRQSELAILVTKLSLTPTV